MRGAIDRPDYLYEAARVYLMLGAAGPLDRDLLRTWMALDWQATYPGAVMAPVREDLTRHLNALFANRLPQIPLDAALIATARTTFTRVPLARRVYSRIASSGAAQAVPPWRPADALGAAGVRVFMRASGKPLTDGIPGFYTIDGFYKVLLPALGDATKQVASESWVLGSRFELAPHSPEAQRLEHEVIELYEADYIKHWDAMLKDLSLVPLRTLEQAAQDLYILGSPQSPIRDLLVAIARQLTLSQPPPAPPAEAVKSTAEGIAKQLAPDAAARLKPFLGTPSSGPPPEPPGKKIDDRYRALRGFVGTGPGAPIDQALKVIDGLHQQLATRGTPAPGAPAPPAGPIGGDSVQLLRDEAARDPPPVARWLEAMAGSANALISGRTRQQAAEAWNAPGSWPASLCQKAVTGRYPFVPSAPIDIPMDDFARLFSPGRLIDGFFSTQLRPYVNTSGRRQLEASSGRRRASAGGAGRSRTIPESGSDPGTVLRCRRQHPAVRFDITPVDLDAAATQVTLDIGGTTVIYAHGPQRATQITWPGQAATSSVRLVFDPPPSTGTKVFQASGAWALFRLFEQGTLKRSEWADRYKLTFATGDRRASYEIRAGSVINPFEPGLLAGFQCPKF
jgi:type VI secretion system protein ImpL